ncbi:MAG: redoxin domain-containing protein [Schleiferiaceae bacterium]|jgi:peroxiredoxin|nr:redoxin domain-containing protein [Schleiferiaceae bacterium]
MKKILLLLIVGLTGVAMVNKGDLNIGDSAPMADSKMEDITGKKVSLNDAKMKNGLLVIFSCNTCPYVIAWEDQYPKLKDLGKKHKIGMVLVNSNEAKRKGDDSIEEMRTHSKDAGYNMDYLVDPNSELANAFGANTTPHVYLFDGDMKLVYKGAINDKFESSEKTAKKHYLEDAMNALGKGKEIELKETQNRGCSIKRV